ncbi:uncharacterized protein HD556DRAFT_1431034 [Suillus plorans]|uniref:Uncharacterized protein n=1 Tax=Suillus plorans TaxID=116603 RepID=A0A9P7DLJ8_9AGAM|nr:uncharacterized protein HD556DRAFT_1431034 [Suillus plorans]KAG1797811.1 hypothetical protein HD556DRAFT_1431034 [Suillus plorans]
MALLCRHDRVLWVANLTSTGEKQHYALALLDRLFKHLPTQMTIGLLYDIGCQLEWSCRKFYGQLYSISHCLLLPYSMPMVTKGFGQSDGEGCEQLWSFLKPLIPSL